MNSSVAVCLGVRDQSSSERASERTRMLPALPMSGERFCRKFGRSPLVTREGMRRARKVIELDAGSIRTASEYETHCEQQCPSRLPWWWLDIRLLIMGLPQPRLN